MADLQSAIAEIRRGKKRKQVFSDCWYVP